MALAHVLEAERPEVRAAGGWARQIGPHPAKHWVVFHFVSMVVGPAGQGILALVGRIDPSRFTL